jgi:uncharacterized protein YjdB
MSKSKDDKINRKLKISFIVFLISAIITLTIILNKGVIFGKRLIDISETGTNEPIHIIQVVADKTYLKSIGDSVELKISIDGEDVTEGFELISSDEDVIKLENNVATSVGLGTAVIVAKSTEYNVENSITLDVVVPITKLTLSAEFPSINVGETDQVSYTTKPKDSNVAVNMIYESSDKKIATVDSSGIVTGISSGTVTITGTDRITGISDSYEITIK